MTDDERRAARSQALNAAVEVCRGVEFSTGALGVLGIAKQFENYLLLVDGHTMITATSGTPYRGAASGSPVGFPNGA